MAQVPCHQVRLPDDGGSAPYCGDLRSAGAAGGHNAHPSELSLDAAAYECLPLPAGHM